MSSVLIPTHPNRGEHARDPSASGGDEQTTGLAKQLDNLQRRGVDAVRVLDLAVRRKPLPVDRATAALAYRVRSIATAQQRRPAPAANPFDRRPQQRTGPAMGL